jgi:hypothetical protein
MAINDLDGFVIDEEELDEEEFVEIPNTGIDGYIRPILISSDNDPEEIINLNAGNLRVDENAYVIGSVGIGTTIPTSDLEVVGDVKISGIVTASKFVGDLVGIASTAIYASTAGIATYATSAGIATYATSAGIATYAETAGISTTSQGLTGTPNIIVGIVTATTYTVSGSSSTVNETPITIDASQVQYHSRIASFTAARTVEVSNLTPGRWVQIYIRNTNASSRTITVSASTTTTGFSNVNLAVSTTAGSTSAVSFSLAATSGTAVIWVANIDGDIVGSVC